MKFEEQQKLTKMFIKIPLKKLPSMVAQEMVKDLRERQQQYDFINKPWQESRNV